VTCCSLQDAREDAASPVRAWGRDVAKPVDVDSASSTDSSTAAQLFPGLHRQNPEPLGANTVTDLGGRGRCASSCAGTPLSVNSLMENRSGRWSATAASSGNCSSRNSQVNTVWRNSLNLLRNSPKQTFRLLACFSLYPSLMPPAL